MLKVVAADGDTGLSALAHVVDGLPYLSRTQPLGKTVDGGPQLSHAGGRIPSTRQFGKVIDRFKKNGSVHKQDNGGRKVTVMTEENIELVQLSLRKGALWTGHYLK